jgi:hypothetical protein
MIDNKSVIVVLREIIKDNSIEQGIKKCYKYFLENEVAIKKTKDDKKEKTT